MKNVRTTLTIVAISALLSNFCMAEDVNNILGKWIERFPNGNGMVTEFTANTISFYPVDEHNTPQQKPSSMAVTYKDLGETIGVNFQGGGGVIILPKDMDNIALDFPGVSARFLTRMKQ